MFLPHMDATDAVDVAGVRPLLGEAGDWVAWGDDNAPRTRLMIPPVIEGDPRAEKPLNQFAQAGYGWWARRIATPWTS